MKAEEGGILSVRLRRPTDGSELEVRLQSGEYRDVDAVFTSVKAVENILVLFYGTDEKAVAKLHKEVQQQQLHGVCFVLHKYPCGSLVPKIDWSDPSPIIL